MRRTDPPAKDVEHAGDILDRGRWVQFMEHRERPAESGQSVPGC